jgi:hypothetical protein
MMILSDKWRSTMDAFKSKAQMISVWVWLAMALVVGACACTMAWKVWLGQHSSEFRNPCRGRGWMDYVLQTEPRRANEELILVLSNSQGVGVEVTPEKTYSAQLQELRQEVGRSTRVVNWSVPGWRYADMITIAAAAKRIEASAIVVVLMPDSFEVRELPPHALQQWSSDLYYLLGNRDVRAGIPESVRAEITDMPLWANIAAGTMWPAWRARTLPAALISRYTPWGFCFDLDNMMTWFGPARPRDFPTKPDVKGKRLDGDEKRAATFLDVVCKAAPVVQVVNIPIQKRYREADDPAEWMVIEAECRKRGVSTWDWAEQVPEPYFARAIAHFTQDGHRMMAAKLDRVLP